MKRKPKLIGTVYRVFLFNDDHHTFDEVIIQLIKAINCSFNKARTFAFEVHVKGKSMVFSGSMQACLKVSSILEEIALTHPNCWLSISIFNI